MAPTAKGIPYVSSCQWVAAGRGIMVPSACRLCFRLMLSTTISYQSRSSPLEISEREVCLPLESNYVLIKTGYTSLNPIDIKRKSLAFFSGGTVGLDFAGTVEAVASNINQFKLGDRVCGVVRHRKSFVGTHTLVNVSTDGIIKTPAGLSDREAAGMPLALQAALSIVDKAALDPTSRVLILGGATSVGSLVVQLLKKVYKVENIVVTSSPRSFRYAKSIGAKINIDYTKDMAEQLVAAANPKFNAIIDIVGGYDALRISDKILEVDGLYLTIVGDVFPATHEQALNRSFLCSLPRMLGRFAFGSLMGIDWHLLVRSSSKSYNDRAAKVISEYDIKVRIDSVYPLQEVQSAWDKLNRLGASGKVVIQL